MISQSNCEKVGQDEQPYNNVGYLMLKRNQSNKIHTRSVNELGGNGQVSLIAIFIVV